VLTTHPVSIERQRAMTAYYESEHKRYRFWRRLLFLTGLAFFTLMASIFFFPRGVAFTCIWVSAMVSWAASAVAFFRVNYWQCPACGEAFGTARWYRLGPLALHCVHCGFPKEVE
jgi:cell division protein FtsW (lipid II flippase)